MATDDRKRRIMEHLAESSGGKVIKAKKTTKPETPIAPKATPAPTPPPAPEDTSMLPKMKMNERKRKVMNHVNYSSNFGDFSLEDKGRKKKVMDHVRKSQNNT